MVEKIKYWFGFIVLYKNWPELLLNRLNGINSRKVNLRNGYKIIGSANSPLTIVMDETFILRRYTPKEMVVKTDDVVVDIGANVGIFSIFAYFNGASKIISYEPDPTSFKDLRRNIKINNIDNIKAINLAITNKKGLIEFYTYIDNGGNSVFNNNKIGNKINVQSIKLIDIFEQNKIDKIDFLKIDCEGSEGLIFSSTNKKIWSKINKIALEYHDNVSPINHLQIIKILKRNNFNTRRIPIGKVFGYIYAWKKYFI